jgi:hypothetical protein
VFWLAILGAAIAAYYESPSDFVVYSAIFSMVSLLFLILDSMQITINHQGWTILVNLI